MTYWSPRPAQQQPEMLLLRYYFSPIDKLSEFVLEAEQTFVVAKPNSQRGVRWKAEQESSLQ
jgi:hypothetical protein